MPRRRMMGTRLKSGRPSSRVAKLLAAGAGLALLGTFGVELLAVGLVLGVACAAWRHLPVAGLTAAGRRRSGVNPQLIMLGAGALAVLAVAMVFAAVPGPAHPAGTDGAGARAASHYMGVEYCTRCHCPDGTGGDQYTGWRATAHGADFTNRSVHGEGLNLFTRQNGSCQPCHVVGYNYTDMGGFDPSQAWGSGNNSKLLGVQCEDCHGPGSDLCEECHGPPIDHSLGATNMVENPTPEQSCNGGFAGAGCHGPGGRDVYTSWSSSLHSPADQRKAGSSVGLNTYCARCKSPSQYDPTAAPSTAKNVSAAVWRGIACADCHDSHGNRYEGQLKAPAGELCGGCHTSERPVAVPGTAPLQPQKEMFLGISGANVSGTKGMPGTTCTDCHMWTTPSPVSGVNLSDYTGYPKIAKHSMTPTAEACGACHSGSGNDMPAFAMPSDAAGANATDRTAWDTFLAKYRKEVEKWNATISDWQSETEALLAEASAKVTAAGAAIESARLNRTKDADTLAVATALWGDAFWNCKLVENDGSTGVHNHKFAKDLLDDAIARSKRALGLISANSAPSADAGPGRVASTNQEIPFDGSASRDMDGTVTDYFWDFGDGSNSSGRTATHAYADNGYYYVKLTVTDDRGATGSAVVDVFVKNRPPRADAGPDLTAAPDRKVSLDGSGSTDSDGTVTGYRWDLGDGTSGEGARPTHAYARAGVYPVILTATDDDGAIGMDWMIVTVAGPGEAVNLAPVAVAGNDLTAAPGAIVTFDGSGSTDADGTIAGYTWSFGDGTFGYGATADHVYAGPGVYAVVLTVTDDRGVSGIDVAIATVQAGPPPLADLTPLQDNLTALQKEMARTAGSLGSVQNDTASMKKDVSDMEKTVRSLALDAGIFGAMVLIGAMVVIWALSRLAGRRTAALRKELAVLKSGRRKEGRAG